MSERPTVWIAPHAADSAMIRALTEYHHPHATIFPRKRPKGTEQELAKLRAAESLR